MKFYFSQTGNSRFSTRQIAKEKQNLTCDELRRNSLLEDLQKTKEALENAYAGFDNVIEPDLIDCYIYELNSITKRYNYLLEQVGRLNKERVALDNDKAALKIPVPANQNAEIALYSDITGNLNPKPTVGAVG